MKYTLPLHRTSPSCGCNLDSLDSGSLHPNLLFCINGEGDARPRLGRIDCEIRFAPPDRSQGVDLLFHDFLTPTSSPENAERLAKIARPARLEGFPLLHLDFYKDDPAALRWPGWIASHRLKRTAPKRGIRYQRLAPAVEAVLSNAGLMICGLALIHDLVDAGTLALLFSPSMGGLARHAFQARFRVESRRRSPVQRFRNWLVAESAVRARITSWAALHAARFLPQGQTPELRGTQAESRATSLCVRSHAANLLIPRSPGHLRPSLTQRSVPIEPPP